MVPTSQIVFPGSYAPDAPDDMYAGIGKNGQIMSIAPTAGLVVIRMGDAPDSSEVPFILCNQIWQYINNLDCNLATVGTDKKSIAIYPNPSDNNIHIANLSDENFDVEIENLLGAIVLKKSNQNTIDISHLHKGIYMITITQGAKIYTKKLIKN